MFSWTLEQSLAVGVVVVAIGLVSTVVVLTQSIQFKENYMNVNYRHSGDDFVIKNAAVLSAHRAQFRSDERELVVRRLRFNRWVVVDGGSTYHYRYENGEASPDFGGY